MRFNSLEADDIESAYQVYRELLKPFVVEAFGWDEIFQKNRFNSNYKLENCFWCNEDGATKAFLCRADIGSHLHMQLLLVYPSFQRNGVGSRIMKKLHELASEKGVGIILHSFNNNVGALRFYMSLGYTVVETDEHFSKLEYNANCS